MEKSAVVLMSLLAGEAVEQNARPFAISASEGHVIHGQVDLPAGPMVGAVVLVAGTGTFDRDVRLGNSGTKRDAIFADLGRRFALRGLAAVRYDRRGVVYDGGSSRIDPDAIPGVTAESLSRDLEAVYAWTGSQAGLSARCVSVLVHSEGAVHLAGVARRGQQPPPALVVGIGALLESKIDVLRWQSTERDAASIEMMDADGDGVTTNAEVNSRWRTTPSAVFGRPDLMLQQDGSWTADDVVTLRRLQAETYDRLRSDALGRPDDEPYPDAATPAYSNGWWKTWFEDNAQAAEGLARWDTPMIFHYGSLDPQTRAERQIQVARDFLASEKARFVVHPDRGHSLGPHPLVGPMDEAIADHIVDEVAAACSHSAP